VAASTGQAGNGGGTYLSQMPTIPTGQAQIAPSAAALNGLTSAVMTPTSGTMTCIFFFQCFFKFFFDVLLDIF
jgi:hypothetical protein